MTRRHPYGALALLAVLLVVTSLPGGVGESMAVHQKASVPDPDSTFRIGRIHATPLEVVEVPLELETANLVNYFTNQIGWDSAQLHLINVTLGSTEFPIEHKTFLCHLLNIHADLIRQQALEEIEG